MVAANTLSHQLAGEATMEQRLQTEGYGPRTAWGENVTSNRPSAQECMAAFMASANHRSNILGAQYHNVGIGVFRTDVGGYWVTQNFGTLDMRTLDGGGPRSRVEFTAENFTVAESAGFVDVTIHRTGGSAAYVAGVECASAGGTADGSDFSATSQKRYFLGEGNRIQTFRVPITNDSQFEGPETIRLVLGGFGDCDAGSRTTATLTIQDDEQANLFKFRTNKFHVGEGSGGALISVDRTGSASGPASVEFSVGENDRRLNKDTGAWYRFDPSTLAGRMTTARQGQDFSGQGGTLNFAPGETTKSVILPILEDSEPEPWESVDFVLGKPQGGSLDYRAGGGATGILVIEDNDGWENNYFRFDQRAFEAGRAGGAALITIRRVGGLNRPASIVLALGGDSTAQPLGLIVDGLPVNNTTFKLDFPAGVNHRSVIVRFDPNTPSGRVIKMLITNPYGSYVDVGEMVEPCTSSLTIR